MILNAGIVTYNPELDRFNDNISKLIMQFDKIMIFDNGSDNYPDIKKLCDNYSNTTLINGKKNYGIGYALNRIMEFFEKNKTEWVLLLDQDSIIPENLKCEYLKVIEIEKNVAIVCPSILDNNTKQEKSIKTPYEKIGICITSGSMTNVSIWKSLGGFREDFFIDSVDNEYCIRLFFQDYSIIRCNNVCLNHELGKSKKHLIKTTTNHNETRRYYIARNSTYVSYKYAPILKKKIINKSERKKVDSFLDGLICKKTNLRRQIQFAVLIILYENHKIKKLKSIVRGYFDGIKMYKKEKTIRCGGII